MSHLFLALAIHNHQPVGNFPWVFEDAYRRAYLPMVEALVRHPSIRVSLHYSGCLFDWIIAQHPELITYLRQIVATGQAEVLSGGYYEPILSAIPDADKLGQIGRLSDFVESVFRVRPTGMWLAERVWEPGLALPMANAGIDWTLVDDTGFKMVGMDDSDLFGYFNTEEQGRYVKLFPISKYLRYSIPWHSVADVIAYLKNNAAEGSEKIAVMGDDGEKFGVWPQTFEHCWEKHWVDDFFKAVEDNASWLSTIRLGDYASAHKAAGRVYLPCAAYDEMLEWSLPAERSREYAELRHKLESEGHLDQLRYVHAGFWRSFMVKYPEINRMHKKMLLVHEKVHRARQMNPNACGMDSLWQAQCNCPYWHGVFGGIYLSDIRAVTYSNLINAEKCADRVLGGANGYTHKLTDFEGDGYQEVLVEGPDFNLYFSPNEGGSLFEWDLRSKAYNLLSTVSRKPEAYHKDLAKPAQPAPSGGEGVKSIHDELRVKAQDVGKPAYDKTPRSSLVDRFLRADVTLARYENNEYQEAAVFSSSPYDPTVDENGDGLSVRMRRLCEVNAETGHAHLVLEKGITVKAGVGSLAVEYRFTNKGKEPIETIFCSEWNINLLGGGRNDNAYYRIYGREIGDAHLDSRGELEHVEKLLMGNSGLGIELELALDRPLKVWRFPVESISNSEGGVEKVYQCSCVAILVPLKIGPGQEEKFSYTWNVQK